MVGLFKRRNIWLTKDLAIWKNWWCLIDLAYFKALLWVTEKALPFYLGRNRSLFCRTESSIKLATVSWTWTSILFITWGGQSSASISRSLTIERRFPSRMEWLRKRLLRACGIAERRACYHALNARVTTVLAGLSRHTADRNVAEALGYTSILSGLIIILIIRWIGLLQYISH